jgi:Uma2 family endonuclease
MVAAKLHEWTVDEFLAFEAKSDTRHQLIDGQIYDMAGGTSQHSVIKVNTIIALGIQLRQRPCRLYDSDMMVRADSIYTYPDISVVCGEAEWLQRNGIDVLLNPTLIVEVLSPSTAKDDQTWKLNAYRRIPGVQQVVVIAQDTPKVTVHFLNAPDQPPLIVEGIDAVLELTAIGCTLALRDVYDKVTFDSQA